MSDATGKRVAVFGATGHTGRFVVEELLRRGFTPAGVARDPSKLVPLARRGIETWTATVDDAISLETAFSGASAVINCAGPFLDTADAVVVAALRAGAHYLDVTAEQASALATLERFDAAARSAGVLVLPAMGFYGGFADLLATAAVGNWHSVDAIEIFIGLDRWHPTGGTRATGKRNRAQRLVITKGRLAPFSPEVLSIGWDFDEPLNHQRMVEVPLSEAVLIARHLQAAELHTYINEKPLRDLGDEGTPPPTAVDKNGSSAQIFQVDVLARRGKTTRRVTTRGRDIYAFTAPFVVEGIQQVLNKEAPASGAYAPGSVFESTEYLDALATAGHLAIDSDAAEPAIPTPKGLT